MPSLRDIAIVDARSVIRQVYGVKSSYFQMSSTRSQKVDKNSLPKTASADFKSTILEELLILANEKTRLEENTRLKKLNKFENIYKTCIDTVLLLLIKMELVICQ